MGVCTDLKTGERVFKQRTIILKHLNSNILHIAQYGFISNRSKYMFEVVNDTVGRPEEH